MQYRGAGEHERRAPNNVMGNVVIDGHDVLDWMEEHLKDKLLPGDLERRTTGELVWQNNTCWERFTLVQEGILKSHSPRGIWELTDGHR